MSAKSLRIIPTHALSYDAAARSHKVADDFVPERDALFLQWDPNKEGSVDIWDSSGAVIARGPLGLRTLTDVRGRASGHRTLLDRVDVWGQALGYLAPSNLIAGDEYVIEDTALVSALPAVPKTGFAAQTRILTERGNTQVKWLEPGMMVDTRDNGPQPLRDIVRCAVPTTRKAMLATLQPGDVDAHIPHRPLVLAPDQPILFSSAACDLYFDTSEVLTPARARGIVHDTPVAGAEQTTLALLIFDTPQLVCAEGVWSASQLHDTAAIARLAGHISVADMIALRHAGPRLPAPRRLLTTDESALLQTPKPAPFLSVRKSA